MPCRRSFLWLALSLSVACGGAPAGEDAIAENPAPDPAPAAEAAAPRLPGGADTVRGAGSTFVYPIARQWSRRYYQDRGVEIVYEGVGSAGGLEQLDKGEVAFAATDIPLPLNELERRGYAQWPIIAGAIVPVVNLLVEPGQLVLDGPALAGIFLGKIDQWNDPMLRRLNPGLALPASPITVVQRGDASGTAYNFSDYLSMVSLDWRQRLGVWSSSERPVGVSASGNAGVAELVASIPNSIGYVSFAYARQAGLIHTRMMDRHGATVPPTISAFRAAMAGAKLAETPDFTVQLQHGAGGGAWPILATTYIVVKKNPADAKAAAEVLRFFSWCYQNGAAEAEELLYVAMPDAFAPQVEAGWSKTD